MMFSNKSNPPPVGQYDPRKEKFMESIRTTHVDGEHLTAQYAQKRKFEIAKQQV